MVLTLQAHTVKELQRYGYFYLDFKRYLRKPWGRVLLHNPISTILSISMGVEPPVYNSSLTELLHYLCPAKPVGQDHSQALRFNVCDVEGLDLLRKEMLMRLIYLFGDGSVYTVPIPPLYLGNM
jgi:hypothetical protein